MKNLSKLLAAGLVTLAFAGPALAQFAGGAPETQTLAERNVYLFVDGKMVRMAAGDTTHAMIMKEFKPMKAGTMIYVSGGRLYMAEDKKMGSGKMLHHEIYGREIGASGG